MKFSLRYWVQLQVIMLPLSLVASEQWIQVFEEAFTIPESNFRRQGIANDEAGNYYFSSFHSLTKAATLMGEGLLHNFEAIPSELKALGDDHIGGIDYWNGTIYAPMEDGGSDPAFQHPVVVLFDAETLQMATYFELVTTVQPDGLPWVCVDPANGVAYSSKYANASAINAYDLHDFSLQGQLGLANMNIDSVQGGKVFNGSLYLVACAQGNSDRYAVYRVHLTSGAVEVVASLAENVREIESLTFVLDPATGETMLYVLAIQYIDSVVLNYLKIRIAEIVTFVQKN